MKFVVVNEDLRAALLAVKAHASIDKDDMRARALDLSINADGHMLVSAANGWNAGIARVPLMQDEWSGELGRFTIDRDHAAQIAGMFREKAAELEITVTGTETPGEKPEDKPVIVNTVKIRQLGQLFGGDEMKFSTPHQDMDVATIWHEVGSALRRRPLPLPLTRVDPKRLAYFRAAAAAYDEPLQLSVADNRGALIVQCGKDFIGHCHAWVPSSSDKVDETRMSWSNELPLKLEAAS